MPRKHYAVLAVLVGVLVGVVATATLAGAPAAAETTATLALQDNDTTSGIDNNSEYYNGSADVENGSWFDGIEDASIDSMGVMATRLSTYFIGTGELDSSGTGFQGALLTGVVMAISLVAATAGVGVGPVGGSVVAVVIGYGLTEIGLAPAWFRILLLFAIGSIAFVSFTNVLEAR